MKIGDTVTLITNKQGDVEADHYTIIDNLKVGGLYSVIEEERGWVMLDGYDHWHYGSKFKVVAISEEAKQHLKDFLDFLLKEGYCDTDVYSEPPTVIDQYLTLINKKP